MSVELDRLQRFRQAVQRLDPMLPLSREHLDWYVERPDGAAKAIAGPLQLDPSSVHLVVGAIGCGKSTELLAAGRELIKTQGVFARYVEVSRGVDLSRARAEAVIAIAAEQVALELLRRCPDDSDVKRASSQWRFTAHGGFDAPGFDEPPCEPWEEWHEGLVPKDSTQELDRGDLEPRFHDLIELTQRITGGRLVLGLDGLDRLRDPQAFDAIAFPLVGALRHLGVGAIITGPWRLLAGVARVTTTERRFDTIREIGPISVEHTPKGHQFISAILESRDVSEMFDEDALDSVIRFSGGIPRDLLHLARAGLESAWVRGADRTQRTDIDRAADRLGREMVLGLTADEIRLLEVVDATKNFVPTTDEQRALIPTKRVLQYSDKQERPWYAVHPVILPLLQVIGSA